MNIDHINEHYFGDLTDPATERARQRVHWICGQARGQDILDIGCSQGIVSLILGREGFRCTGIDIEAVSLEIAREALAKEDEIVRRRVTFQIADASQLPFKDESFDTVVLCEVLEHLTHPVKVLSEAKRVLRHSGRLIVTVPYGLNAYHDHKVTFYPLSLLEVLQPLFKTQTIDTLSNYITYLGVKDRTYDPEDFPKEVRFDEVLRLEKQVEERCLEKERELLELGTKLYAQIKFLTTQSMAQTERIKAFEEGIAGKDKIFRELEIAAKEARGSVTALRAETAHVEAERTHLLAEVAGLRVAIEALQQQLVTLQAENSGLRGDLVAKEEAVVRQHAETMNSKTALAEVEQRLAAVQTAANASRTAWQQQLQVLQAEIDGRRRALEEKEEALVRWRAEAASSGAALAATQEQLATLQTEITSLRQALLVKEAAVARLRDDGMSSKAALTAFQTESNAALAALRQQHAIFQKENDALRQELTVKNAAWQQRFTQVETLHAATLREREKQLRDLIAHGETELKRKSAIQQIRILARTALPADARVLVISKGDDDLLQLDGRQGWHFPQTSGGVYAGCHPADSAEAIAHLETLKAKGAQFLLVPASSFWWLDYYVDFRRHLEANYRLLTYDEESCLIFALRPPPSGRKEHFALSIQVIPATSSSTSAVSNPAAPAPVSAPATPFKSADAPAPTAEPARKDSTVVALAETAACRQTSSGKLAVGAIFDLFTAACFHPECELVTFRPDNWRSTLERTPVDMLFVESAWQGNGGSWQYKIASFKKPMGEELVDVINYCKSRHIPTVFWNKEDPPHFGRFIHRAPLFDFVFTSDADMIPKYREAVKHNRVFALPFAAQPQLHCPILEADRVDNVCFAGAYYATDHDERRADMDRLLRPALAFGLHIYDRQHGVVGADAKAYRFPEIYQAAIKGRLEYSDMVKAYKRYKVFLNVNSVKQSPTMFSRRVFELLASGTPVISSYSKGIVELLGTDTVHIARSEKETKAHLDRLLHDEEYWAKTSLKGVREVLSKHTYAHRWAEICKTMGMPINGQPLPMITALANVDSADHVQRLTQTLARQSYRHFCLTVMPGKTIPPARLEAFKEALPDIPIQALPRNSNFLEQLAQSAGGNWSWLINLDDYYGENFLKDAVLATVYSDAQVIGKHTCFEFNSGASRLKLTQPGHEFRFVMSASAGSIIAKAGALKEEQWKALASNHDLEMPNLRVLSIDRFNYVKHGGGIENPRTHGGSNPLAAALA